MCRVNPELVFTWSKCLNKLFITRNFQHIKCALIHRSCSAVCGKISVFTVWFPLLAICHPAKVLAAETSFQLSFCSLVSSSALKSLNATFKIKSWLRKSHNVICCQVRAKLRRIWAEPARGGPCAPTHAVPCFCAMSHFKAILLVSPVS